MGTQTRVQPTLLVITSTHNCTPHALPTTKQSQYYASVPFYTKLFCTILLSLNIHALIDWLDKILII